MANDLTAENVLTIDTAAVISATNKFKIRQVVYAAPAAAVGQCQLKDGSGKLILTMRAPTSDSVVVDLGGRVTTGLEVANITAASNLSIYLV